MSSCLTGGGGGGRTYGFDLDVVKTSPSPSRSSHSSSRSSILSESSNSALAISIKKARTPRKRLNQTYNEAAALLSAIYPTVFPTKNQKHLSNITQPLYSFPESPALLPSSPVLSDSAFLIHRPPPEKPISAAALSLQLKHKTAVERECTSPVSNVSWEPNSPERPFEDELDADSMLDEEVEKGIDTIMGNLRVDVSSNENNSEGSRSCGYSINPLLRSLVGCQLGDRLELSVGFGFPKNLHRALRKRDEDEWWRSPVVPMRNIIPNYKPALDKKHNKKKANRKEVLNLSVATSTSPTSEHEKLKPGLGLKLNHEEVLKEWSGRGGSMFTDRPDSPNLNVDALTRLADIDLFPDSAIDSDVREASVLNCKDKRRTHLYSKKVRYQVRKVNADCRPRTKGRFARKPCQSIEEES